MISRRAAIAAAAALFGLASCDPAASPVDPCEDGSCDEGGIPLLPGPEQVTCSRSATSLDVECLWLDTGDFPLGIGSVDITLRSATPGDVFAGGTLSETSPRLQFPTPEGLVLVDAQYNVADDTTSVAGAPLLDQLTSESVLEPGDTEALRVPVDLWPAEVISLIDGSIRFEMPSKLSDADYSDPINLVSGQRLFTFVPVTRNAVTMSAVVMTPTADSADSALTLDGLDTLIVDANGLSRAQEVPLPDPLEGDPAVTCSYVYDLHVVDCEIPTIAAIGVGKSQVFVEGDGQVVGFTVSPRFGGRVFLPVSMVPERMYAEVELKVGVAGLPSNRFFTIPLTNFERGQRAAYLPFRLWSFEIYSSLPITTVAIDDYTLALGRTHADWFRYETGRIETTLFAESELAPIELIFAVPPDAEGLAATIKTSLNGNSGTRVELYPGVWTIDERGWILHGDSPPEV